MWHPLVTRNMALLYAYLEKEGPLLFMAKWVIFILKRK